MKAVKEHVPFAAGEFFAAFSFALPRFNVPCHYHLEMEITLEPAAWRALRKITPTACRAILVKQAAKPGGKGKA